MRRLLTALGIAGLFALSAAPVMAAPADVFTSDPVTGSIDCGANQYTFISGTWRMVTHAEDTTPSGDLQFSVSGTADDVTVIDQAGALYRVEGIWHFGGAYNPNLDKVAFHFGMKLHIIGQDGGSVDSVNVVYTLRLKGDSWLDFGSCQPLG